MPPSRVRITPRPSAPPVAKLPSAANVVAPVATSPTEAAPAAAGRIPSDPALRRLVEERGRLLTTREVAAILGVAPKRVYELPIPRIKLGEGAKARVAYNPYTLEAWLASRTEHPNAPPRAAWVPANRHGGIDLTAADVGRALRVPSTRVPELGIPVSDGLTRERSRPTWDANHVAAYVAEREAESARDVAVAAAADLRIALSVVAAGAYRG